MTAKGKALHYAHLRHLSRMVVDRNGSRQISRWFLTFHESMRLHFCFWTHLKLSFCTNPWPCLELLAIYPGSCRSLIIPHELVNSWWKCWTTTSFFTYRSCTYAKVTVSWLEYLLSQRIATKKIFFSILPSL